MSRSRTRTNVLALRGAFKGNPGRAKDRADEPPAEGEVGPPPGYFSAVQTLAYGDLMRLSHAGVLCAADAIAVEVAAVLLARARSKPAAFTAGEVGRLQAMLGTLGMTPTDRSEVKIAKPRAGADALDEFEPAH